MSGSTFQPPIHLDPTQGADQQTAFINQNFQTLASALETNSFRIVVGPITTGITTSGNSVDTVTIAHGLGYAPIPFGFMNDVTITGPSGIITNNGNLPLPTWVSLTGDTIKSTATNSGVALPIIAFKIYVQIVSDATNVYILLINATGSGGTTYNVTYYLTQQPAA